MAVTWNPNDKSSGIILSEGDLKATASGLSDWRSVRATDIISDKRYWEIKIIAGSSHVSGIGTSLASLSLYCGNAYGYGYSAVTGNLYHDGSVILALSSYGVNDTIGFAYDSGNLWFAKNNSWNGDPANGTSPTISGLSDDFFPMYSGKYSGYACKAAFAESDLVYSPPSGFLPLDYAEPKYLRCTGTSGIKCRMTGSTGKHLILRGV